MTKKDFEVLAAILNKAFNKADPYHEGAIVDVAEEIADHCGERNLRFDRAKFFEAAGVADWLEWSTNPNDNRTYEEVMG